MAIFQKIELGWGEDNFVIPPERVMGVIAEIEEIATFPEIVRMRPAPNFSKLARCYAAALRYAGARVTDEDVYAGMFRGDQTHVQVLGALDAIMNMMMPPSALAKDAGAASEGNQGRAPKARSSSSKHGSKRRSAAAG